MKVEKIDFHYIQYRKCDYNQQLYDSLIRIGLSFPIYVQQDENGYHCIDGKKRMSAIANILKSDPTNPRFQSLQVIVVNYARSAPPYHLHNHH